MSSTFASILFLVWGGSVQPADKFWEELDSAGVRLLIREATELKQLRFADAVAKRSPFGAGRGLLLVVQTDESAWCVLECQFAARRRGNRVFPVVLVRRLALVRPSGGTAFVREGMEWFAGLELDCDIGQVVPPSFGGDLALSGDRPESCTIGTRGEARLWLVERLPERQREQGVGQKQGPERFSGGYELFADGELRGKLNLEVSDQGIVRGRFISSETGQEYAVGGRFGGPEYRLRARITFPQSVQDLEIYFWRKLPGVATGLLRSQSHVYGVMLARPGAVQLSGDH